jgi:hypothetical protein
LAQRFSVHLSNGRALVCLLRAAVRSSDAVSKAVRGRSLDQRVFGASDCSRFAGWVLSSVFKGAFIRLKAFRRMPPKKVVLTEPAQLDGALRVALRVGSLVDRLLGNCFFMLPQPDGAWVDANLENVEIKGPLVAPKTDATLAADREVALALYARIRGFVAQNPFIVLLTDCDRPVPAQRALTIQYKGGFDLLAAALPPRDPISWWSSLTNGTVAIDVKTHAKPTFDQFHEWIKSASNVPEHPRETRTPLPPVLRHGLRAESRSVFNEGRH